MRGLMAVTKALADENRVRMLMALRGGELCVCQLIALTELAPSTVSKHMSILRGARLVESRKDGRWINYRLAANDSPLAAYSAIKWMRRCLDGDDRVKDDDKRLRRILKLPRESLCGCAAGRPLPAARRAK